MFPGTDPIGAVTGLRFDQTKFDSYAYFSLKTRPTQTKYLQCDTRLVLLCYKRCCLLGLPARQTCRVIWN